ncbi:YwaF family protein [Lysinibacillus sp. 54212]|uniref:YwaF family protein n=1 Tax=Lysinibacillus sp. 54212 TaxID=3119829 RepID=UPI002FC85968
MTLLTIDTFHTGFELFQSIHIGWLILVLGILLLLTPRYKKASNELKFKYKMTIFLSLLLLESIKQIEALITGSYTIYTLPLHLCGLGMFVIGLQIYKPSPFIQEVLFSITLPGTLSALIFPGWAIEPVFSYLHFHGFLFHALLLYYCIFLLASSEIKPRWWNIRYGIYFLLMVVPPTYVLNKLANTNFMFINWPAPDSPLELLETWLGNPGYILGLVLLVLVLWNIQYSLFFAIKKCFVIK